MIRSSLILALLSLTVCLSAQDAQSVFIEKRILKYYETELASLYDLKKNISEQEGIERNKSIKELKNSTEDLSKKGMSMYITMSSFLNKETIERLSTRLFQDGVERTALEDRNAKMRANNPNMREILMTEQDLDAFLDNLNVIRQISEDLKYSHTTKKMGDVDMGEMLVSAEAISTILNKTY